MFLNISKRLQTLLKGVMDTQEIYLTIYSDDNWAIENYWSPGGWAFNPQEETEEMLKSIASIINDKKVPY